jgi:hypothetical protein
MALSTGYVTSIHGRRIGLQPLSTGQVGASRPFEVVVGPEVVRQGTVSETTGTNLAPYGVSLLTTQASSGVYVLDPPVPGVEKTVVFQTTGTNPIYLKTANGETFLSSQGTTFTVLVSSQGVVSTLRLVPVSTAIWGLVNVISTASVRATSST